VSDGRYKNLDHKQDPEWQRQQAIYCDPPGKYPANQLVASMRAVFAMQEIEQRVSC